MGRSMFEEFKASLEQQIQKVGPVKNLHGIIDSADIQVSEPKTQQWRVFSIETTAPVSIHEALNLYTYERPGHELIESDDSGAFSFPQNGADLPPNRAIVCLTVARIPVTRSVPMRVTAEGYSVDIYINNARFSSGHDSLSSALQLGAGEQALAVVLYGGTKPVTLEIVKDVECVATETTPAAPVWEGEPEVFQLDPEKGTAMVRLEWKNDAQATAWQVYRARASYAGTVSDTADNDDGTYTFELTPAVLDLAIGDELYTEFWPLGIVRDVVQQTGYTLVTVLRDDEAPLADTEWDDLDVLKAEPLVPVAHVTYAGNSKIRWEDYTVRTKTVYVYRITAFGIFGATESEFSESATLYTDDRTPPLGIDWNEEPVVEVKGDEIHISFLPPEDPDYRGVHVYGPYALDGSNNLVAPLAFDPTYRIKTDYGEPNKRDQFFFNPVKDEAGIPVEGGYYFATFDIYGNEQGPDFVYDESEDPPVLISTPAFGYAFLGASEISYGSSTSIEFDVLEDSGDPDNIHTLVIKVYPKTDYVGDEVAFSATLNGSVLNSGTSPALTKDTSFSGYVQYQVTLTRQEGDTLRFIGTASGEGLRPSTMAYLMDSDPFPGLSGTHVENRTTRPTIWAIMDDDAKWLRLVKSPYAIPANVVFTATQEAGTDTSTIAYGTAMLKWTRSTDLEPEVVEEYRIDASKDGVTWRTDLWRGTFQGPPPPANLPPEVQIEVLNPSTTDTYATLEIRVTAHNPNGNGVTLRWKQGTSGTGAFTDSVTTAVSDTISTDILFDRATTTLLDRVLVVRGEIVEDGETLITDRTFIADFDKTPEIIGVDLRPLLDAGNQQTGWTVTVSVDDDTDHIDITGESVTPSVATIDTSSDKVVSFTVTQSTGNIGKLIITPYDAFDNPGTPWEQTVNRAPVTTYVIQENTQTKLTILLMSVPTTATKYYRLTGGTHGSSPSWQTSTSNPVVLTINRQQADMVLEYYSVANNMTEETKFLAIDSDTTAEFISAQTSVTPATNRLSISVSPDDDCVQWAAYAKLGSAPSITTNDYVRYYGSTSITSTTFYALAGSWYVTLVPFDWSGNMGTILYYGPITVSGSTDTDVPPASIPELSNISGTLNKTNSTHNLTWSYNTAASGLVVDIIRKIDSADFESRTEDRAVSTGGFSETVAYSATGQRKVYTYRILLLSGVGGSTLATYEISIADYYTADLF